MTLGRRFGATTIMVLAVACLALASNVVISGSRTAEARDPRHLAVGSVDLTSGTREAIFSAYGMIPGDTVTAAITVANPAREPMTYTMSRGTVSAGGAAMSAALILTARTIRSSCDDFDGTTLYSGPLDDSAFGSPGHGLPLAAATAEILCFQATLPLTVGNDLQGAATTVTLSFSASWQGQD